MPKDKGPPAHYLTIAGAGQYCSLSIRTIRRNIDGGRLPYYKPSTRRLLVKVEDLERWLAQYRIDPT